MQRRAVLASLTAGIAGVAGCLQSPLDASGGRSPDSTADRWSEEPPCPAFDATADRRVCTGGGHPEPSGVIAALQPPADAPLRAGEPVTVTLHPRASVPLTFAPDDWTLHRRDGDRWTEVGAGVTADGFSTVYPEERYTWRIGGDAPATTNDETAHGELSLDPGRYVFSLTASVGRGWTHGERIECAALFAVSGT